MSGYLIDHPLVKLRIKIEKVEKLHIHEEIIPELLSKLILEIRRDGVVKHPVIVDENSLVVLDGTHRVEAIRRLGCKYIPVCLVNYNNPSIAVGAWYRMIEEPVDLKAVLNIIKDLNLKVRREDSRNAYKLVLERKIVAALISKKESYIIDDSKHDIREVYDIVGEVESKLRLKGYRVTYDTELASIKAIKTGRAKLILAIPVIFKEEVVRAALSGKVFTHKSTRHIIPARPLFINIPLEWLYSELEYTDVNEMLVKYLKSKTIKHLPPGQVLDRQYDEELYIFT
ncbi:MAG: ParB N-terminal domain-containing protein [Candidatus Methanomethylicia archaeon]